MNMIYQEAIMDHYRNPRNRGNLVNPHIQACIRNVSCGDHIILQGNLENGLLVKVAFEGAGCVISQASASMLTQYSLGKTLEELRSFTRQTILNLLGIELGPMRIRCSLLVLEALHTALDMYQIEKK